MRHLRRSNRAQRRHESGNINAVYTYDAASQLTGITYRSGATTLGNQTYTYDLAGRITAVANVAGGGPRRASPTF
jgi:YD repeat-containing protein